MNIENYFWNELLSRIDYANLDLKHVLLDLKIFNVNDDFLSKALLCIFDDLFEIETYLKSKYGAFEDE